MRPPPHYEEMYTHEDNEKFVEDYKKNIREERQKAFEKRQKEFEDNMKKYNPEQYREYLSDKNAQYTRGR